MSSTHTQETIVEDIKIHAPADRIFNALTDPAQRLAWWTPRAKDSPAPPPVMESDLRPGGKWEMRFQSWSDQPSSVHGEYRIVDPPRVLEFTWLPDWYENASESVVRFDLSEHAGVTTVRITHSGLVQEADRASHRGWPHLLNALRAFAERP